MATNFPTSLDSLTNPTSSDSLSSPSHAAQHANVNDAVEALQAKVGVDGSAVTSSLDYKLANLGTWTTYTPGTNMTVGNGTLTGKYCRVNGIVFYEINFTLGSTSVVVPDAYFDVPVAQTGTPNTYVGSAWYFDVSTSNYYTGFTKGIFLGYQNTFGFVSATTPFIWQTGDIMRVSAFYQVA